MMEQMIFANFSHTPAEAIATMKEVKQVRCLGTMAAFELNCGSTNYLNPIGRQLQKRCLEQGVYIRPLGNVVYLLPPLCISDQELETCYQAILNGFQSLT